MNPSRYIGPLAALARGVAFAVALVFNSGCFFRSLPPDVGDRISSPLADEIVGHARARTAAQAVSRARGSLEARSDDGTLAADTILVLAPPDRARLELAAPSTGFTMRLFTLNGERAQSLDAQQKHYMVAEHSAKLIREELDLPLPNSDIVSILSGTVPRRLFSEQLEVHADDLPGETFWLVSRADGQSWRVGPDGTPRYLEIRSPSSGRPLLGVHYDRYTLIGARAEPGKIRMELIPLDAWAELTLTYKTSSGSPHTALFELIPPDGFTQETLGE